MSVSNRDNSPSMSRPASGGTPAVAERTSGSHAVSDVRLAIWDARLFLYRRDAAGYYGQLGFGGSAFDFLLPTPAPPSEGDRIDARFEFVRAMHWHLVLFHPNGTISRFSAKPDRSAVDSASRARWPLEFDQDYHLTHGSGTYVVLLCVSSGPDLIPDVPAAWDPPTGFDSEATCWTYDGSLWRGRDVSRSQGDRVSPPASLVNITDHFGTRPDTVTRAVSFVVRPAENARPAEDPATVESDSRTTGAEPDGFPRSRN
jgi:hypothetical protein